MSIQLGKVSATVNAVRDHPQQALISGDTVTVVMKVGQKKAGEYTFPLSEWGKTKNAPTANPNYNQRGFIASQYKVKYRADYDNLPEQGDRIIDAQVSAVNGALGKRKTPAPPSEPVKPPEQSGMIAEDITKAAYREEALTAAVSITKKTLR